jgi:hypothetical protein
MLVSEQRVDQDAAPIRPRRVRVAASNLALADTVDHPDDQTRDASAQPMRLMPAQRADTDDAEFQIGMAEVSAPTPRKVSSSLAALAARAGLVPPTDAAPAPVALSRDDMDAEDDDGAPMPRAAPVSAKAAANFVDYLEQNQAEQMTHAVELGAAYLLHRHGAADFTRTQLMGMVRNASEDDMDREDVLRAFGTLLRDGIFQKVARGQYCLTTKSLHHRG